MFSHNDMANITLSIPEELHDKLRIHNEIRWSELIRNILQNKIKEFELMEKLVSKSKLSFEDVSEISNKIDSSVAEKLGLK